MTTRRATSVHRAPKEKKKKQKVVRQVTRAERDPDTEKRDPAKHVWSITELGERIFRFVPREEVQGLQRVCKQFSALTKFGGVEEYMYDVPAKRKAGKEKLQFRREKIADFVAQVESFHQNQSFVSTLQSCIQGYGGERFVDRHDIAYKNMLPEDARMILENKHCAEPCQLDSTDLAACNLNPGPFKRILCLLLVQAQRFDKVIEKMGKEPMQPHSFQVTCDAKLVGDIRWTKYCMKGKFSELQPRTTFEATVNWIFELLAQYSETRNANIQDGGFVEEIDYVKAMTFWPHRIEAAFRTARYKSRSLEQTCYIVDRIPEERHP